MTQEATRPRTGTRGVPREVRAAEIVEAAAAEFGARGYAAAQVTAVAERAAYAPSAPVAAPAAGNVTPLRAPEPLAPADFGRARAEKPARAPTLFERMVGIKPQRAEPQPPAPPANEVEDDFAIPPVFKRQVND